MTVRSIAGARMARSRSVAVVVVVCAAFALVGVAVPVVGALESATGATTVTVHPIRPVLFGDGVMSSDGDATMQSIECPADGACVAGGSYTGSNGNPQWFTTDQRGAIWTDGAAPPLPSGVVVVLEGGVGPFGIGCGVAGSCIAAGALSVADGKRAVVASMESGAWVRSTFVTFPTPRLVPADDNLYTTTCADAGDCLTVGSSANAAGYSEAIVVPVVDGSPQTAIVLPSPVGSNVPAQPFVYATSVSCARIGECVVTGFVNSISGEPLGVAWVQHAGTWGAAQLGSFAVGFETATPRSRFVSTCATNGTCTVTGIVRTTVNGSEVERVTVAPVVDGIVGVAVPVAMDPSLDSVKDFEGGFDCSFGRCIVFLAGRISDIESVPVWFEIVDGIAGTMVPIGSVSTGVENEPVVAMDIGCVSVGNCLAVGYVVDAVQSFRSHAIYWTVTDGVWSAGAAPQYPSSANADPENFGGLWGVSCVVGGVSCVASGAYDGADRSFVQGTSASAVSGAAARPRAVSAFGRASVSEIRAAAPSPTASNAMTMQVDFVTPPVPVEPVVPMVPKYTG